ncbi:hypothetical protein SISNIDRAFT_468220 [Sistotremastrum niveocremeum HHB9708]|uniref:Uncharacterized protein n=1 Tax=Sistotremastrum niveocremeum HHB9708 TaxID=1314777 RepID=A0A164RXZ9_9AGAM|nr:hypothetical protein SISNIDRAFT_468220 [Sistotremastrum niveocremeum HHB9708]
MRERRDSLTRNGRSEIRGVRDITSQAVRSLYTTLRRITQHRFGEGDTVCETLAKSRVQMNSRERSWPKIVKGMERYFSASFVRCHVGVTVVLTPAFSLTLSSSYAYILLVPLPNFPGMAGTTVAPVHIAPQWSPAASQLDEDRVGMTGMQTPPSSQMLKSPIPGFQTPQRHSAPQGYTLSTPSDFSTGGQHNFTSPVTPSIPNVAREFHASYIRTDELYTLAAYDPSKRLYVLYRAPIKWIAKRSEPLQNLLCIERTHKREGKTDDNAIQLPDPAPHWSAFFEWFNRMDGDRVYPLDHWVSLLALGSKYCMEEPKHDAILQIQAHNLRPSNLLRYCKDYRVEAWFLPSLKLLVAMHWTAFTAEDIDTMGVDVFHLILVLKGQVDNAHKSVINNTYEDMVHVCFNQSECQAAFDAFLREITCRILHPETPISHVEAEKMLDDYAGDGFDPACFQQAVRDIKLRGLLREDRRILRDGYRGIAEYFGYSKSIVPDVYW